jgi:hypothetical protein
MPGRESVPASSAGVGSNGVHRCGPPADDRKSVQHGGGVVRKHGLVVRGQRGRPNQQPVPLAGICRTPALPGYIHTVADAVQHSLEAETPEAVRRYARLPQRLGR